ncbi:TPA: DUF5085 family protein [Staphylococcus aureus]|nr:DUF5085 family protein [Staphylococcus aureus]
MDKNGYSYIMMKNVAYKTYFDVTMEDYEDILKDFTNLAISKGKTITGPLTFAVTQIDLQKRMNIDLFISVEKCFKSNEELSYRTYFCLDSMLHGRITSNNFIIDEIALLEDMNEFASDNNLTFTSPYYHTIRKNFSGEQGWIDVKSKVYEND